MILMEAQDDNIFELDYVVRAFQKTMRRIKYSRKPVVAAPFGMTLGGGAEVCLPAARIQASAETYMGLVEVGVGLIPGGGGNLALYEKALEGLQLLKQSRWHFRKSGSSYLRCEASSTFLI